MIRLIQKHAQHFLTATTRHSDSLEDLLAMARPTRAPAALAGKQANKQATSPYFDKTRAKEKATTTPTGKKSNGKSQIAQGRGSDRTSQGFSSEEGDTSSEDSGDGRDVYKEPDSDAIDEESDGMSDLEDEDHENNESVVSEDIDGDVLDFSSKKKNGKSENGSGKKKRKGKERESDSPSKKVKKTADSDFEAENGSDNDDDASEEELEDGRKVVRTKLVKAPSSTVKPGLVDPHTMQFLSELRAHNDREWFAKNGECSY